MKNGPYTLIVSPENYPGKKYRNRYVYEHRLVWWKNTGNLIPENYDIHHKNGVKTDNRFSNLELIQGNTHSKIHALSQKRKIKLLICDFCGKPFQRRIKNYNPRVKLGKKTFFCSRSCGAKNQHLMKIEVMVACSSV